MSADGLAQKLERRAERIQQHRDRAKLIRQARRRRYGVQTNWAIIALTDDNYVVIDVDGDLRNSLERPSEWIGLDHLMPSERAILRRGLTAAGRDRAQPRP